MSNGGKHANTEPDGEESLIQTFLAPLARGFPGAFGLKDDCALVTPEPGTELVLTTDPIVEGVHFLPDDPPADIGWKALAVNVSDLAAKAAMPIGYLMALSFPDAPSSHWMAAFAEGLRDAQTRFGCHLMGGDMDRVPGPLSISITAVGSVPQGKIVPRAGAKAGDALFVSGTLGDAALGLLLARTPELALRWGLSEAEAKHLHRRYRRPEPRLALAHPLRQFASAAMDISDGLAKDLDRMCRASGRAAQARFSDLPLSPACAKALAAQPDLIDRIVAGGDDYEILAAVPRASVAAISAAALGAGVRVTEIGRVSDGLGVVIEGPEGHPLALSRRGWDHFPPNARE